MDDANAAYRRGDYAQTLKILRPLAAQGNAEAQKFIGLMYSVGDGVIQNDQEALKWYRLAAVQGDANAQTMLGTMYASGKGVRQSHQVALKWFRLAAAGGVERAQTRIGEMYYSGEGVTQNYQEALKWYRLAASQGDTEAQIRIGVMYRDGEGVTKSYQEALKWFRLAEQRGRGDAQNNIGWMYLKGKGVTQDHQEALKWFRLAANPPQWRQSADAIANLKRPEMIAAAQNLIPDRQSTSIKTGTQQEEQVSIKTNRKTEQPRRTATRTETPERASPPKLIFSSSTPKSDGTVELSGRVISDASISEILINGRALEVSLGRDNSFTVTRGLPMGAVTSYRLSVMDEYGQKAETEINVERAAIQYAEQVAPLNPRKLKAQTNPNAVALIIGIEAYSRLPQAQYADSDATHFYDYANQSLGVPPHKIKLLTDTKANRIDLLLAMRSWMKTEVNGKSDVYIFFAGHGLASADGSKTYLLPADGDRDLLDETSILRDDLIASAKGAKTITLFLDTCYSGGTRTNEVLLADARPIAIVPDKSALPSNVTVLAAASGAQLSSTYEAAQQGLFSYWLMKGLEGDADTNKDKKITTGELHEYVAKQVGPMAQRRNRQQDPQLMGDSTRVIVSY
jgi:TPR repeat protein